MSPALDLIEVAQRLRKLESLLERTESSNITDDQLSRKNREALLVMILLKLDRIDDAARHLKQLKELGNAEHSEQLATRSAEAVVQLSCRGTPELQELIEDWFNSIARRQRVKNIWTIWDQQFKTLSTGSPHLDPATATSASVRQYRPSGQWASVNVPNAETRGNGIPLSQWTLSRGRAANTLSHGNDHLYFYAPLRGDFEVECDCEAFGWRDSQLLVGGTWVNLRHTLDAYDVGSLHARYRRLPLTPKMTKLRGDLHYRAVVRGDVTTTFIIGRAIHEQQLLPDSDPWVALRNDYKNEGGTRNLRVTGNSDRSADDDVRPA